MTPLPPAAFCDAGRGIFEVPLPAGVAIDLSGPQEIAPSPPRDFESWLAAQTSAAESQSGGSLEDRPLSRRRRDEENPAERLLPPALPVAWPGVNPAEDMVAEIGAEYGAGEARAAAARAITGEGPHNSFGNSTSISSEGGACFARPLPPVQPGTPQPESPSPETNAPSAAATDAMQSQRDLSSLPQPEFQPDGMLPAEDPSPRLAPAVSLAGTPWRSHGEAAGARPAAPVWQTDPAPLPRPESAARETPAAPAADTESPQSVPPEDRAPSPGVPHGAEAAPKRAAAFSPAAPNSCPELDPPARPADSPGLNRRTTSENPVGPPQRETGRAARTCAAPNDSEPVDSVRPGEAAAAPPRPEAASPVPALPPALPSADGESTNPPRIDSAAALLKSKPAPVGEPALHAQPEPHALPAQMRAVHLPYGSWNGAPPEPPESAESGPALWRGEPAFEARIKPAAVASGGAPPAPSQEPPLPSGSAAGQTLRAARADAAAQQGGPKAEMIAAPATGGGVPSSPSGGDPPPSSGALKQPARDGLATGTGEPQPQKSPDLGETSPIAGTDHPAVSAGRGEASPPGSASPAAGPAIHARVLDDSPGAAGRHNTPATIAHAAQRTPPHPSISPGARTAADGSPVRELRLRLSEAGREAGVQVRLNGPPAGLDVAVRTPHPELEEALRAGLDELASRLSESGFEARIWRPSGPAPAPAPSAERGLDTASAGGTDGGSSPGGQGRRDPDPQQQQRQDQGSPQRWADLWGELTHDGYASGLPARR